MTVDVLIKGGTIIDGSGTNPGYTGDVAVSEGRIIEIGGRISSAATHVVDADGALVVPGFIDFHTHYDGQFIWDDQLDPSFSHGVTTVVAGNCGVGFAPADEKYRGRLIELMEGVEDIPGIVLDEGLDWSWRSFPEYLDRIDGKAFTMDVGVQLAHAPLRVFVMGERGLQHENATAEDISEMASLVEQAMLAGALGVSAGRVLEHKSVAGAHVPGTFAEQEELVAIAAAMGRHGTGTFQIIPLGAVGSAQDRGASVRSRREEHRRIEDLARASERPVTYLLQQFPSDPTDWKAMLSYTAESTAAGLRIRPQTSARGIGMLSMLDGHHIFRFRPSYLEIAHLPRAQRAAAMRETDRRAAILAEEDSAAAMAKDPTGSELVRTTRGRVGSTFRLDMPLDYEPGPDKRLDAIARAQGVTPQEVLYDHLSAAQGEGITASFFLNYGDNSLDAVYEMMRNPLVANGLGDGGAHMRMMCDASMPTFTLSFWGRDRSRGPRIPLESLVHKLTRDGARLYGLTDRGLVAEGMRADLNVIDFQRLGLETPVMTHDLPSGGGRILQGARGYLATLVDGVVTRRHDAATGAKPGRLIRATAARG
ncbi:N-acyl-D-amino-acid deacylase family protein [Nocardia noduli]|uniref:N-acyl-D-amino-acid deacylase family protein n=1 Tax=Nocardia noduli TaxID=2815722 RepID=UPI001C23000B|nr:amidohydrolase family protein [Nocardia noduli]